MAKILQKIYSHLNQSRFDAMLVSSQADVCYLTGFTGHDAWAIVTGRQLFLITDSRYSQQACQDCPDCKIIIRQDSLAKTAADILNKKKKITTVAIQDSLDIRTFNLLRKKLNAKIKPTCNIIEKYREIKTLPQANAVIKAGKIAIKALKQALKELRPGMTETHLAAILDYNIKKAGSCPSFQTIAAFGANASRPHHRPGLAKLKKNDTILIDFGAVYNNYTCDITRCFTIGRVNHDYINAYKAVFNAQKAAIKTVKANIKAADVAAAARDKIAAANLPQYGHGTGHGLGLEVHELPVISTKQKKNVTASGQIFTIEPGVYIPGKFGIRIEDDILVTKTGYKILTPKTFANSPVPTSIS